MLYNLSRFLIFLFLKIFCRLKVYGRENIPKTGGFILASNHTSYLDPLVVGAAVNRRVNFMARHDLFLHPVLRWWMSGVGAFPVKRDSADLSALKEAISRLKRGEGLVLFPEGTRSIEGSLGEAEPGIGLIAVKSQSPVIPTFVKGAERAMPKGAKLLKPQRIYVYFGKPISIERRMPYQDIAGNIMQQIRHLSCPN